MNNRPSSLSIHEEPFESFTSEEAQISEEELPFSISEIDELIPLLVRIGHSKWRNLDTGETLDLDDVIAGYGEQLPLNWRI